MRLWILVGSCFLLGCSNPKQTGELQLDQSIRAHGGLEAYQNTQAFQVVKTIRLFDSTETLESETRQFQVLRHTAGAGSSVGWQTPEGRVRLTDHGGELHFFLSDSLISEKTKEEQVRSTIDGAKFVLFQPFKLYTDKIDLKLVGPRSLDGFGEVQMYRLQFPNPSVDRWYFYFDTDHYLVANEVVHNGRRSLIENLEFQQHLGLMLHKHRKSYFVDSLHSTKRLRAEYFYDYFE